MKPKFNDDFFKSSPEYKARMVDELEAEIKYLKEELEQYKDYRIYYEMSFQLNHGKKP